MIKILCIGKIKEKYLQDFIKDYEQRIMKYHKLEIIEVKDDVSLEHERDFMLKHLSRKDYIITLDINGLSCNSIEFAKKIEDIFVHNANITFIIGSSLGIHEDIKKLSHEAISFSSMTFPHGLFRGILLEQIYRAFKIINHESYHK